MKRNQFSKTIIAAAMASLGAPALAATYAPWLTQIGLNDSILSASNWGKGVLIGVVDTGIQPASPAFAKGQISTSLSSCAAVSFPCGNGYIDDNSHGTAVASIAAANAVSQFTTNTGMYAVKAGNVISVAPNANLVAEKVLSAAGSGYSTDVANGIIKAANAGASVINLSLTYGNSGDLVNAVNYAASKGVFIVWAGGNSSQALLGNANSNGLTAAAISHLILVGSVNAGNGLSSFSNTPGGGKLISTTGASTSYASRWVMAPGEGILAPYVSYGSNAWGYWSGTSMSAPVVSGSIALLESTWKVLQTQGTAGNLLLATAKDLGAAGVDSTYGNGLVNLGAAFQPVGGLNVTGSNGKSISVYSLTGSMITGGALGSLSSVQKLLANYTAFDGYQRNFSVNLSGLILSKSSPATLNPLPSNPNTGPTVIKLQNGGELALLQLDTADDSLPPTLMRAAPSRSPKIGFAMMTDRQGSSLALGYGVPVQYAFAKSLYADENLALQAEELSRLRLSSLAEGGGLASYGMKLGDDTRVAISWSGSQSVTGLQTDTTGYAESSGRNMSVGFSSKLTPALSAGMTVSLLNQQHGLLGSSYASDSPLALSDSTRTVGVNLNASYLLSGRDTLLLEAGFARSDATSGAGLLAGTSALGARSWGVSLQHRELFRPDDRVTLSVMQPLRVSSGRIGVVSPTVDADTGLPGWHTEWVSAAPSGQERDYQLGYATRLPHQQALGVSMGYNKDADNISGNNQWHAGVSWSARF